MSSQRPSKKGNRLSNVREYLRNCFNFRNMKSREHSPLQPFFQEAEAWINECGYRHRLCPLLTSEAPELPTRVLKFHRESGSWHVRLHESAEKEVGRYTALSHCWGHNNPTQTRKDNYVQHLSNIPWSSLSKTFQDAIEVSHGLGINYLWIDSLCIVQDNEDDWAKESAVMKDVYGFSYVTIAAAGTRTFAHGLYLSNAAKSNKDLPCDRDLVQWLFVDNNPQTSLFLRAWIFQERLLASRILYFFESEVVFECSNHIACQCSGISDESPVAEDPWRSMGMERQKAVAYKDLKYQFTEANISKISKRMRHLWSGDVKTESDLWPVLSTEENLEMLALWDLVVQHYVGRNISKPTDRLPAFSGIAGAFGSTGAHGAYHAGLWETWFVYQLLWCVNTGHRSVPLDFTQEDLDAPIAPSWSWAKLRGAWHYHRTARNGGVLAKLIESRITLASNDRFGAVREGVVTIHGPCVKAKLQYEVSDSSLSYEERFSTQNISLVKYAESEVAVMLADFVLDSLTDPGQGVTCLGLQTDIFTESGQLNRNASVYGVVLQAVEGEQDLFRRIGIFSAPTSWYKGMDKSNISIC